jgi:hypothetical protein
LLVYLVCVLFDYKQMETPKTRENSFLYTSSRSLLALILAVCLIPAFVNQDENGNFRVQDNPDMPLITLLLPTIGWLLGYDVDPTNPKI